MRVRGGYGADVGHDFCLTPGLGCKTWFRASIMRRFKSLRVGTRTGRGARSLKRTSMYWSHKFRGSMMCMSESMILKPFCLGVLLHSPVFGSPYNASIPSVNSDKILP